MTRCTPIRWPRRTRPDPAPGQRLAVDVERGEGQQVRYAGAPGRRPGPPRAPGRDLGCADGPPAPAAAPRRPGPPLPPVQSDRGGVDRRDIRRRRPTPVLVVVGRIRCPPSRTLAGSPGCRPRYRRRRRPPSRSGSTSRTCRRGRPGPARWSRRAPRVRRPAAPPRSRPRTAEPCQPRGSPPAGMPTATPGAATAAAQLVEVEVALRDRHRPPRGRPGRRGRRSTEEWSIAVVTIRASRSGAGRAPDPRPPPASPGCRSAVKDNLVRPGADGLGDDLPSPVERLRGEPSAAGAAAADRPSRRAGRRSRPAVPPAASARPKRSPGRSPKPARPRCRNMIAGSSASANHAPDHQ